MLTVVNLATPRPNPALDGVSPAAACAKELLRDTMGLSDGGAPSYRREETRQ
jgi:hypothetical protein